MNEEGTQHHVSLNGSLVLLDRPVSASGSTYQVEVVNGHASDFRDGPSYSETITGKGKKAVLYLCTTYYSSN